MNKKFNEYGKKQLFEDRMTKSLNIMTKNHKI